MQNLDFSHNQISDVNPVSGLTNLRYLYLYANSISIDYTGPGSYERSLFRD